MEIRVKEKVPGANCELQSDGLYLCNTNGGYSESNVLGGFYVFLLIFFVAIITTGYFGIYKGYKKNKIFFYILLSILILLSIAYYFKDIIAPWIYI